MHQQSRRSRSDVKRARRRSKRASSSGRRFISQRLSRRRSPVVVRRNYRGVKDAIRSVDIYADRQRIGITLEGHIRVVLRKYGENMWTTFVASDVVEEKINGADTSALMNKARQSKTFKALSLLIELPCFKSLELGVEQGDFHSSDGYIFASKTYYTYDAYGILDSDLSHDEVITYLRSVPT